MAQFCQQDELLTVFTVFGRIKNEILLKLLTIFGEGRIIKFKHHIIYYLYIYEVKISLEERNEEKQTF